MPLMSLRALFALIAMFVSPLTWSKCTAAQNTNRSESSSSQVVLAKLFAPRYPQMARIARVTGEVEIRVEVRRDGSASSASVLSGHPLLRAAALESTNGSIFDCTRCGQDENELSVTYAFNLRESCGVTTARVHAVKCLYLWKCGARKNYVERPTAVAQSGTHVTVLADPACYVSTSE